MRNNLSINGQSQRRYIQLYVDACTRRTVIILDLTGTRFDIAQTAYCALYLIANVVYNTHRFVDNPPIAEEIHSIEYWSLNVNKCKYIGYDRGKRWHSVNQKLCSVFGNKCEVLRSLNCRHINNIDGDTFN
jgi:hypothetical protein